MKAYTKCLVTIIAVVLSGNIVYAALPSHTSHPSEKWSAQLFTGSEVTAHSEKVPGHHAGGFHFGPGFGRLHFGGWHPHFSFHGRERHYKFAGHLHHNYYLGYNYHAASAVAYDFAGLSIFFDILGIFTLGTLAVFGIIFGAIGIRNGDRPGLAKTGFTLGIIEVILGIIAISLILAAG